MGAMAFEDNGLGLQIGAKPDGHRGAVIEEIRGLIKVYKGGHIERPLVVPSVPPSLAPEINVESRDVQINSLTGVWARIYVPKVNSCLNSFQLSKQLMATTTAQFAEQTRKLPMLVYFHGGGFCVGSAAWKCYHDFLGDLSSKSRCVIASVNYRLAPENPLPAAYEDGINALAWLRKQVGRQQSQWWATRCDLSMVYLGGDSAGANVAYNVALKLGLARTRARPVGGFSLNGVVLIHPFIGGEERTRSEEVAGRPGGSALSLSASDAYWRMALPPGATREHPWCNPLGDGARRLLGPGLRVMVCVAEMDMLRDRNLEICSVLGSVAGNEVECLVSQGVGHAFQVLDRSQVSMARRQEMISHVVNFLNQ